MTAEQPQGPDIRTLTLSDGARSSLVDGVTSPRTLTGTNGVRVRAVSLASDFENRQGEPVTVVVGLSTSEVDRTLHRLVLIEIAIGAAAVAVALLLTSWGVRLSLRPLRRVTSTAREVTAELSPEGAGLDRRVPVAPSEVDTEAGQMAESVNTLLGAVETQFAARVASEERMRQFMADASHELRTPLTSIRGYAELARMRRANGTADVDSDADTLNRIESEGTRMSRLVDDLLLLARTDRGAAPQLEPVDTADLVSTAVEGAQAAFPQRHIEVAVDPDVPLYGDYDQLLRVVRNLVTNAAVHTAPGWSSPGQRLSGRVRKRLAGGRFRAGAAAGRSGPGVRPILARRQGPDAGPWRQRTRHVDRPVDRRGPRRDGTTSRARSDLEVRSPFGSRRRRPRPAGAPRRSERSEPAGRPGTIKACPLAVRPTFRPLSPHV